MICSRLNQFLKGRIAAVIVQHHPPNCSISFSQLLSQIFDIVECFFLLQLAINDVAFKFLLYRHKTLCMIIGMIGDGFDCDVIAECLNCRWE